VLKVRHLVRTSKRRATTHSHRIRTFRARVSAATAVALAKTQTRRSLLNVLHEDKGTHGWRRFSNAKAKIAASKLRILRTLRAKYDQIIIQRPTVPQHQGSADPAHWDGRYKPESIGATSVATDSANTVTALKPLRQRARRPFSNPNCDSSIGRIWKIGVETNGNFNITLYQGQRSEDKH
jgi:hypothetical protein